jgi:hypothetical protein
MGSFIGLRREIAPEAGAFSHIMKRLLTWGLVAMSALAAADSDKKYTLADLKALVQQQAFQEAVEHLGDVAPSARTAEWQDVAGQSAVGIVHSMPEPLQQLAAMIGLEQQYPTIVKHSKYVAMRNELAPRGLGECWDQANIDVCLGYAGKFIDSDPTNAKLALAIAKVARHKLTSYSSIPLFKRAAVSNRGTICKDEDFVEAVTSSFGLPTDYANAKDGRALAAECWDTVRKPVVDELDKGEASYYRTNACMVMKDKRDRDLARLCKDEK